MPVTPTYPGVYIQEIPSGVRTITGVATAITAFIGRARRGPVDQPVTINNFGDFERAFGGLWLKSSLGFAVRDFFRNGGGQAIIVRVQKGALPEKLTLLDASAAGVLFMEAADPGLWGNDLRVRVEYGVPAEVASRYGLAPADMFSLIIRDGSTGQIETFRNLSMADTPRRADRVLANESRLMIAAAPAGGADVPEAHAGPMPVTAADWDDPARATSPVINVGTDGILVTSTEVFGNDAAKTGINALRKADLFNLLCIPPYLATGDVDASLVADAAVFCEEHRAMLLVDPPMSWTTKDAARTGRGTDIITSSKNAALFFPRLKEANPLRENQLEEFVPCGAVAGIFSRTDAQRGVWKAPAGLDATLNGVQALSVNLTDAENGELNPLGINCLRTMPAAGPVVWGARTLQGDDRLASEWKYIPVRRTALYIEESLYRGTQWVVFEPNDEPLWSQIRLNLGAFMHNMFLQGAFQGKTPREAYLVKCDRETTTQNDINLGIVNIVVGFAPLKPAEFVIIKIQQLAGQLEA